jgi:putative tryptophan/tyrosine transport system substrate-binding protein
MPVIGFLSMESPGQFMHIVNAFRRGLSGAGYVEHRNVGIDYSWAEGRPDRLPALAAELVSRQVTVIAATGGPQSARAAKAASATIPIVFVVGSDPMREGLVTSLNRPGGNLTGVMLFHRGTGGEAAGTVAGADPTSSHDRRAIQPEQPHGRAPDERGSGRSAYARAGVARRQSQ